MQCSECGFTIWAKQDEVRGAHLECLEDPPLDQKDLEDQLTEALKGNENED